MAAAGGDVGDQFEFALLVVLTHGNAVHAAVGGVDDGHERMGIDISCGVIALEICGKRADGVEGFCVTSLGIPLVAVKCAIQFVDDEHQARVR